MNDIFVIVDNIKYVNLGTINHIGVKYLVVQDLKPNMDKKFIEVIEDDGNVRYQEAIGDVKTHLSEIFNKKIDVILSVNDSVAPAKRNKWSKKVVSLGTSILYLIVIMGPIARFTENKFTVIRDRQSSKEFIISLDLKKWMANSNIILQAKNDVSLAEKRYYFIEELSRNKNLEQREKDLLIKLNAQLMESFDYVDFNNFHRNVGHLRVLDSVDENIENVNAAGSYTYSTNEIKISSKVSEEYYDFIFIHEALHMAKGTPDRKWIYPFCRIFEEGGTELLTKIFTDDNNNLVYHFEMTLFDILMTFVGDKEFFENYFNFDHEANIEALGSSLKDRDKVIAMLSNAEEYLLKKKIIEKDLEGKEMIGAKDMERNFIAFHKLLLELYYNKQVEKIMSDYYINGNNKQNTIHFLADTDYFVRQCRAIPDHIIYEEYLKKEKAAPSFLYESLDEPRKMAHELNKLYCEVNDISIEDMKKFKWENPTVLGNSISDLTYYRSLIPGTEIIKRAGKDTIYIHRRVKSDVSKAILQNEVSLVEEYVVDKYKTISPIDKKDVYQMK